MPKRKPLCDIPGAFEANSDGERVTHVFQFELITPMFGGETESWELNLKAPIRAQSIKGQLRFWWRTMQPDENLKDLLHRENELWGGKYCDEPNGRKKRKRSAVSISVSDQIVPPGAVEKAEMENRYSVKGNIIPKYVLFPITHRVKDENYNPVHFITEMTFCLLVHFPKTYEKEILNTLKLWMLFGGVGARNRRGAGSLYCEELMKEFNDVNSIGEFMHNLKTGNETDYPTLYRSFYAGKEKCTGLSEWHSLINKYSAFRQARTNKPKPGRSFLPEPDAIRRVTGTYSKHQPNHPDDIWFPRATFGLPIVIEFQNGGGRGDPGGKFHLEPDIGTGERFPSPVVLKIVRLATGKIIPVCLVLSQKFPHKIKLKWGYGEISFSGEELPTNTEDKVMNTKDHLNGRSIYQALADKLQLEEVK